MKRYNIEPLSSVPYIWTIEHPEGEWVKYSDVEKEMKRIWGDIMPPPGDILKSLTKGA